MSKKPLRSIKFEKGKLELRDEFELIFERTITKFGNGAKIDAPKDLLGRKVYKIVMFKFSDAISLTLSTI